MLTYRRLFIFILLMTAFTVVSVARDKSVKFAYDVDFEMNFDNRELYKSAFSRSMTIFGVRVTPSVGLSIAQPEAGADHKVMIGVDVMKDFGGRADRLLNEVTLYYRLQKDLGETDMTMYAGIFPRKKTDGEYSPAFFSDSLTFYDNNLEGLLLQFNRPKAHFEVACDWMGQYGNDSRERFMIFSSGEGRLASMLSLGYSAYMYHYANSDRHKGVVDNILINPYLRFDFGHMMNMQKFSMRFGWLQGLQNDREHASGYVFPGGGEFDLEVRNWNVGILNRMYYGTDLMPYYNSNDNTGTKYGPSLYMGDPFYRVYDNGTTGPGLYDRLEVFYEPDIKGSSKYLKIRLAAIFHFNGQKYCGTQQMVQLKFNLQELLVR